MASPSRLLVLASLLLVLLAPAASAAPTQVHLGIPTDDPSTTLSVVWAEDAPRAGAEARLTGPDGTRAFPARQVTGPGPGVTYEATLSGLTPGAKYELRIDSRTFSLEAPPAALGPGESFTFAALGDMGVRAESRAVATAIQNAAPAFVLHAGDLSYAEDDFPMWRQWFDMIEPVAAERPWITALGNHEMDGEAGLAFYKQRFSLPGNELWYSFDWAGVHFVALDTFSDNYTRLANQQKAWLAQDLAAHKDAPWTIVFLHEPVYSSNRHGSEPNLQRDFVPLFEAHGVDLVITAHDHAYERTFPLVNGTVTTRNATRYLEHEGVLYLVTGGGGRSLYDRWEQPAPNWSAARAAAYHFVKVTVSDRALEGRVITTNGGNFTDSFQIVKPDPVDPGNGNGGNNNQNGGGNNNQNGNGSGKDGEPVTNRTGTPAPPLALVAPALVAAALLLRRARRSP